IITAMVLVLLFAFLSDYKTLVSGKDVLSVTENPPFISTLGSDPDFLNIDPSVATQVEEGATPITLVPEDYAGSTRNSSTPDIGAWEINGTLSGDVLYPTLLAQAFTGNNCSTTARTLTVSLTDVSGIAAGSLSPRVYYKVNAGSYNSAQGTLSSGTALNGIWTFNLSYLAAPMDVISYYVVAQDIVAAPNVLASPATGFAGSSVSVITSPPTSLYSYTISIPVVSVPTSTACTGNTASLTATGTGISTYAWSGPLGYSSTASTALVPSITSAAAGIYTLTATGVSGCSVTTTASLTVYTSPVVTASVNSVTICSGQSAVLSATGAVSYVWIPGNMNTSTVTVTPVSTTNYSVTGTNALGCTNTASLSLMVNPCTGIAENTLLNTPIRLFPNPTSGSVTLEMPFEGSKEIVISNALGQTVQHLYSANNSETLHLATFPKGIYLVKVLSPVANTHATLIVE
ncbi:MAG: T9SS type A sorting domain-containing protein, partial [Bacteroidota bacterium]